MLVNIYLTKEEKYKLDLMCRKYQVSLSTIAQKVLFYFTKYALIFDKLQCMEIGEEYKYMKKGKKTCIKPKLDPCNNNLYKNLTRAYTNALKIYLHKNIDKYTEKENVEKYYNDINTDLQKTNEKNWDYNRFVRSMKRYEGKK